jgi:hypothetical protein
VGGRERERKRQRKEEIMAAAQLTICFLSASMLITPVIVKCGVLDYTIIILISSSASPGLSFETLIFGGVARR